MAMNFTLPILPVNPLSPLPSHSYHNFCTSLHHLLRYLVLLVDCSTFYTYCSHIHTTLVHRFLAHTIQSSCYSVISATHIFVVTHSIPMFLRHRSRLTELHYFLILFSTLDFPKPFFRFCIHFQPVS